MRKRTLLLLLVGLVLGQVIWAVYQFSLPPKETEVKITMNLENTGWYWTQFHLPSGGELMVESTLSDYLEFPHLGRVGLNRRFFVGEFCCGETIMGRYVFLPTSIYEEASTLLFFSPDNSVWQIEVPKHIRSPQTGETSTIAYIYQ